MLLLFLVQRINKKKKIVLCFSNKMQYLLITKVKKVDDEITLMLFWGQRKRKSLHQIYVYILPTISIIISLSWISPFQNPEWDRGNNTTIVL